MDFFESLCLTELMQGTAIIACLSAAYSRHNRVLCHTFVDYRYIFAAPAGGFMHDRPTNQVSTMTDGGGRGTDGVALAARRRSPASLGHLLASSSSMVREGSLTPGRRGNLFCF
jgi:hypothetical protein